MDSDAESTGLVEPQYPGEDTRLTSTKELGGWYSYGWASEVFVICGVGMNIYLSSAEGTWLMKPTF